MRELGCFIGEAWKDGSGSLVVRSPFDGHEVARIGRAGAAELKAALDAAAEARGPLAALPAHSRATILERAAMEVARRRDELAQVLVEEAGKPLALARVEADRCAETFADAARVARSAYAELLDLVQRASR